MAGLQRQYQVAVQATSKRQRGYAILTGTVSQATATQMSTQVRMTGAGSQATYRGRSPNVWAGEPDRNRQLGNQRLLFMYKGR
jgi:hypothetical protein